jgi:hypothetical protein
MGPTAKLAHETAANRSKLAEAAPRTSHSHIFRQLPPALGQRRPIVLLTLSTTNSDILLIVDVVASILKGPDLNTTLY